MPLITHILAYLILNAAPSSGHVKDTTTDVGCLLQVDTARTSAILEVNESRRAVGRAAKTNGTGNKILIGRWDSLVHDGPTSLGEQDVGDPWRVMKLPHTFNRKHHVSNSASNQHRRLGFFASAVFFEWLILGVWIALFIIVQWFNIQAHTGILCWILLAAIYNALIWIRLGHDAGVLWSSGYALEAIFCIEKIFVFYVIGKAFSAPRSQMRRAVRFTICTQVVMQGLLFMGLAAEISFSGVLSSLLGFWLICAGAHTAREESQSCQRPEDCWLIRCFQVILGEDRFAPLYAESGAMFLTKSGTSCCTLMVPLVFCLILADCCFQMDVTLIKFHAFDNGYIAFTSSAVASFAMPDLFAWAQELFRQFHLLKYGTSFTLVFFGMQRLFNTVLHLEVPALVTCALVVFTAVFCIGASCLVEPEQKGDMIRLSPEQKDIVK